MSWLISQRFRNFVEKIAIDDDNALVASSLEEFYLDSGAYFKFGATEFINVPAYANETPGQLQFELEHESELIRVFGFSLSTLSNKYKIEAWETDARDVSAEEADTDITEFRPLLVNRVKPKPFPGTLYMLEGAAEHTLPTEGYELVYSDAYIIQASGGPTDAGLKDKATTAVQLNSKNYVFRILNYDDTDGGREFAIIMYMGVSDYLEKV